MKNKLKLLVFLPALFYLLVLMYWVNRWIFFDVNYDIHNFGNALSGEALSLFSLMILAFIASIFYIKEN